MEARNGSSLTKVYPNLQSGIIEAIDHYQHGRCFSAVPTPEMVKRRINSVGLYLKLTNRNAPIIIFHTPGTLTKTLIDQPWMFYINRHSHKTRYAFEYEIHKRLNLGSETSCEINDYYNYDLCKHQLAENRSLALFNCTTPYGPNKENICTNQTVAKHVMGIYLDTWREADDLCKVPCKSYNIRPTKMVELSNWFGQRKGYTLMSLFLKGNVITSNEVVLYSGLSMLAEIGGYVGLFLGVSITQTSTLIELLYEKYQKMK